VIPPELLKGYTFFAGLNEAELKSLSIIANEVSLRRGDFFFQESEQAHTMYLLLDGWVDIVIDIAAAGTRRELVTTLTPGDIFGWSAVVQPHVYTASAICASPVRAVGFGGSDLRTLFSVDHKLCYTITTRICRVIAMRLCATRLQMIDFFVTN
jgi:CRP-like cAMP-binding protein